MYTKATIDFNSPESVVMAITDYVEFNKEEQEKMENMPYELDFLREELAELRSECNDLESQANRYKDRTKEHERTIKDLNERILQLGGGGDLV